MLRRFNWQDKWSEQISVQECSPAGHAKPHTRMESIRACDNSQVQNPAEIPDDLVTQLSGTIGVGNLFLSGLLARLRAFQLP